MRPSGRVRDPGPEWAALPTSRSARWLLPRQSGPVTSRTFLIHHPVTIRSRIPWRAAQALATRGGLQYFRASAMVPLEVWEAVAGLIPKGGGVAVARANHPGRYFAIVVSSDGELLAFVKVARDTPGAEALHSERTALETFTGLLPPPLFAPRILEADQGILVLEAIEWRRRARPWELPLPVAEGLGGFFRASTGLDGVSFGATHGDCAPWNLLRAEKGWALVDWESAHDGAPPFFDAFHFLVQSSVELKRPGKRAIIRGLELRGQVGASLEAYASGAGLDPREARGIFSDYLRYSAARVRADAPSRALRVRTTLLRLLGGTPKGSA